jgi:hypothetical protein
MPRFYTVPFSGTLTNTGGDADLLEVLPADDKPVRLRGWVIGQTSEVGDATAESIRISVIRLPATVTGGNGTAVTPAPLDSADAAPGRSRPRPTSSGFLTSAFVRSSSRARGWWSAVNRRLRMTYQSP